MTDTIAALATPPGRGAVGIVRLSGDGALAVARAFIAHGSIPERRPVLRTIWDGKEALDRALVTFFPKGASYTCEPSVEISAHGSPYVLSRLLELCVKAGARLARPGEFTQRAFLNGRMDLAQAEAVCDLISAQGRLAHRSAINRLEGGLSRKVAALRGRIVSLLAQVEASLDHPDDDLPSLSSRRLCAELSPMIKDVRRLLEAAGRSRLLSQGARIAIVGRPNAGKSSLLNALLGIERAIVSKEPGTTRDTIEAPCELDGLAAVLVDTAGLRETRAAAGPMEAEGMARAETALSGADLALLVLDRTQPFEAQEPLFDRLAEESRRGLRPLVAALNKSDLPGRDAAQKALKTARGAGLRLHQVSALRGTGLKPLCRALAAALAPGLSDASLSVGARHALALKACLAELESGAGKLRMDLPELAADHLRRALEALDDITGHSTAEHVLEAVFSRFCVGK
ncbi:MAG: tRNA uridine-5-carboxymethylaminomethyl(34) synthesis GTPase MnmE [Elusimicrobia bacterium]|nr:tRNA uridine-5-carboxymethylaminomethyl(34) synthesis GTPase MnmE [Elusimicrobiota bacterium]